MSHYQKLGIHLVRTAGFIALVLGVAGILYGLYLLRLGSGLTPEQAERWLASVLWLFLGAICVAFSRVAGRWLGRGLQ